MTVIPIPPTATWHLKECVASFVEPLGRSMVWPMSPDAIACSWRVSWTLDAPAGLEASSIRGTCQQF